MWALLGVVAVVVLATYLAPTDSGDAVDYSQLVQKVQNNETKKIEWNNNNGAISGTLSNGDKFHSTGPLDPATEGRRERRRRDQMKKSLTRRRS